MRELQLEQDELSQKEFQASDMNVTIAGVVRLFHDTNIKMTAASVAQSLPL